MESLESRIRDNINALMQLSDKVIKNYGGSGHVKEAREFLIYLGLARTGVNTMRLLNIIELFVQYTYPYWEQVNENSLENEKAIYDIACSHPLVGRYVKNIYEAKFKDGTPVLTQKDKKNLHQILSGLIVMMVKYIHSMRKVVPNYCIQVDVQQEIEKRKIIL